MSTTIRSYLYTMKTVALNVFSKSRRGRRGSVCHLRTSTHSLSDPNRRRPRPSYGQSRDPAGEPAKGFVRVIGHPPPHCPMAAAWRRGSACGLPFGGSIPPLLGSRRRGAPTPTAFHPHRLPPTPLLDACTQGATHGGDRRNGGDQQLRRGAAATSNNGGGQRQPEQRWGATATGSNGGGCCAASRSTVAVTATSRLAGVAARRRGVRGLRRQPT